MKQCAKCKIEKPESEFHRRSSQPDGLRRRCKDCTYPAKKRRYGWGKRIRDTTARCSKCEQWKPHDAFYKNTEKRLSAYCKACAKKVSVKTQKKLNMAYRVKAKKLRQEIVDKMGGKCERCGYSEFVSSIDFHHIADKETSVSVLMQRWGAAKTEKGRESLMDSIVAEVEKCVLLCRNCHMGLHSGEWSREEPREDN